SDLAAPIGVKVHDHGLLRKDDLLFERSGRYLNCFTHESPFLGRIASRVTQIRSWKFPGVAAPAGGGVYSPPLVRKDLHDHDFGAVARDANANPVIGGL